MNEFFFALGANKGVGFAIVLLAGLLFVLSVMWVCLRSIAREASDSDGRGRLLWAMLGTAVALLAVLVGFGVPAWRIHQGLRAIVEQCRPLEAECLKFKQQAPHDTPTIPLKGKLLIWDGVQVGRSPNWIQNSGTLSGERAQPTDDPITVVFSTASVDRPTTEVYGPGGMLAGGSTHEVLESEVTFCVVYWPAKTPAGWFTVKTTPYSIHAGGAGTPSGRYEIDVPLSMVVGRMPRK